jgi:hypothetical protein
MTQSLIQAYRQAPWRNQLKWIATFLLGVIVIALVAGLYLSISAQALSIGLEIQRNNREKMVIDQDIANLRNQLGDLTAGPTMLERAKTLGFVTINPAEIEYIVVPGYAGRQTASLAPQTVPDQYVQPMINPEYTQSLSDMMFLGLLKLNSLQTRRIP